MSRALVCDHCEESLVLNAKGEHEGGEDAAWIRLTIANESYDLCTRSCAVAFLDRPEVIEAHNAWAEAITDISRAIRGGDDDA